MIDRLEADFDVERIEGYGLDEELEGTRGLARPSVKLSPVDPEAAPIMVAFTDFPGLFVRFGRWATEAYPVCGCDACGGTGETEFKGLMERTYSLTTNGLRETVQAPMGLFGGDGSLEAEWRGPSNYGRSWSSIDRKLARQMSGGRRRLVLDWKPWPRMATPASP